MINERDYLNGSPLWDSIFNFGNSELIEIYEERLEIKRPESDIGVDQLLNSAINGILELQNKADRRQTTLEMLQRDIVDQIKNGHLIAYGYQHPRKIEDSPIKIPTDIFLSGEINWSNSELKYKALEFLGIRLLDNSDPAILQKDEYADIQKLENSANSRKSNKLNLSKLNPDQYIDEKLASELLGIAVKTLQGYRVKGGGPEFSKFGIKMVRYRVGVLIKWAADRNRKNTIT